MNSTAFEVQKEKETFLRAEGDFTDMEDLCSHTSEKRHVAL